MVGAVSAAAVSERTLAVYGNGAAVALQVKTGRRRLFKPVREW